MFHMNSNTAGYENTFIFPDQKNLSVNTNQTNSPNQAIFQSSPIRRRNNYTAGDIGPMFSGTKSLVPVWNIDKTEQYVPISMIHLIILELITLSVLELIKVSFCRRMTGLAIEEITFKYRLHFPIHLLVL